MKMTAIAYWATSTVLAFGLLSAGVAERAPLPGNVDGMVHLGYPPYIMTIIGFWKVLGSIALPWWALRPASRALGVV